MWKETTIKHVFRTTAEDHLLGREGEFLCRWRGHGASGFRGDVIESRWFYFCRLLFLCALRTLYAFGRRRQAIRAFPWGRRSVSYRCTFGADGILVVKQMQLQDAL